jgi:6-pyruvoyl-tetrahydropterin synthase
VDALAENRRLTKETAGFQDCGYQFLSCHGYAIEVNFALNQVEKNFTMILGHIKHLARRTTELGDNGLNFRMFPGIQVAEYIDAR